MIIFLPNIIIYFVNSINSSHSEYLGIKLIYDRINFIEDFYFTIILKKQFLILILFQILVSFIIKKYDEIKIITYSLIVSPLPFVLIGSSIQSYHLVLIFLEFQIIICIWHFFSIFKFLELKDKVLQIRSLGISSIIFSLVLLFFLGNSWGKE